MDVCKIKTHFSVVRTTGTIIAKRRLTPNIAVYFCFHIYVLSLFLYNASFLNNAVMKRLYRYIDKYIYIYIYEYTRGKPLVSLVLNILLQRLKRLVYLRRFVTDI